MMMNSRERVLTALKRQVPDRVPTFEVVIDSQVMDPVPLKGSWKPGAADGKGLGRVGVTALHCMMNQVYYRYGRVFGVRR